MPKLADFYIDNGLKLPSAQAIAASLAKDTRQRELYANLTLGAGAASGLIALAGVSPALLTWALVNPEKAVQTGLITAETAAGIASGAITPASVQSLQNPGVQGGLGAKDSISALAQQPGMGWIAQINSDPALAGKVDWAKVEEAHTNWHYSQQGLTPEAAAVVTLVVAYFTAGAASGAGASAGNAAAVTAGEGVALTGGGTFVTATGATISTVVGGAVTAGISALAGQAAVALINNKGDIGGALDDLGSSASVKSLLTAIVTGGVLGGLSLNPTGLPTSGAGAQGFMTQLGQNLQAAAARAVIGTAINGGSLEDSLKLQLKTAFIDTFAAQVAHQIGDWTQAGTLDGFTNKIAHAIAGCAIGAAKAASSSGCGAGALGAAIGELSAELYGTQIDTVQFASMMAGIAAAIAGGDASAINLASQTGASAAANNYLKHDEAVLRERLKDKQRQGQSLTTMEQQTLDNLEVLDIARDLALRDACSVPGNACNMARRALNAALSSYTGAAAMTNASLSPAGNAAVEGERDQSIALGNDKSLAAQGFLDGFLEFATPQLAGYAVGGALGAYVNEARALYAAIRSDAGSGAAMTAALTNGAVNPALLNELTANGVKFTAGNVIATVRSPSGHVVFLETGNSTAGLQHIVQRHGPEFSSMGVSEGQIPSLIMRAVTDGTLVGYQGSGTGRPIYELMINGQSQRIAVTISSNGFVVGANPRGAGK